MLTKERCMSLLDDIAGYAHRANIGPNGINEINEDYNGLKKLIEEHFTPQSLEFKDLKEEMMSNRESNCERCNFEENRFYPIQIPAIGENE
jgi:hypothetical protein